MSRHTTIGLKSDCCIEISHADLIERYRIVEETLVIGDRLRELREAKMLSQGDIENRTGLLTVLRFACRKQSHGSIRRDA